MGGVIGDVVDYFTPTIKMEVIYPPRVQVGNGYELSPASLQAKPRVQISGTDMRHAFTLVLSLSLFLSLNLT